MADKNGMLHDMLVTRIAEFPNPIMTKGGTLADDDYKNIKPYLVVIRQKKSLMSEDPNGIHPHSLKARQGNVTDAVKGEWYMMIQISEEQKRNIMSVLPNDLNDPGRQALLLWTEPVTIDDKTLSVRVRDVFLSPEAMFEGFSQ
mgnify:CR=1 FL=1